MPYFEWMPVLSLYANKLKSVKDDSEKDEKTFEIVEGGNCPDFTVSYFLAQKQPKT